MEDFEVGIDYLGSLHIKNDLSYEYDDLYYDFTPEGFRRANAPDGSTLTLRNIYDGQKTGSVVVTGNTDVGSTLSIDWSSFGDTDGIDTNSVAYQWYRDGNIITGQTGSSYQILNSDVGRSISSSLSYLDNWGEQQFVSSNSINLTNSAPEISGLADISVAENLVDASDNVSASFAVSDDLLAAHELSYSFTSSNQALLPDASISTRFSGNTVYVDMDPIDDANGHSTITVFVTMT